MKIIEELEKQREKNYGVGDFRMLNAIKIGKYKLSIQGSKGHYCSPRETLPVERYDAMELAIINVERNMISINRSKLFRKFKWYNELLTHADGLNSKATVYCYVPVELINELYLFLGNRRKLKN